MSLLAQTPLKAGKRIDVHHHFYSPEYTKALADEPAAPITASSLGSGISAVRNYSVQQSLEAMDAGNVETAYLSVAMPGIWFGDIDQTRRLARQLNEFAADLVRRHNGKYGFFAVLPIPDMDASLKEIAYAFDVLKADGVGLLSSYDQRWLGDFSFAPMWEELNRRKAVVFTHATANRCCFGNFVPGIGVTKLELSADNTRSIANVIQSGTASRTPDVTYIWSHGGGTIFSARFIGAEGDGDVLNQPAKPDSKLYHLRRMYYDTASAADQIHIGLENMVVGTSQILFGSDHPWYQPANIGAELGKCWLTPAQYQAIEYGNAVRFLPRPRGLA